MAETKLAVVRHCLCNKFENFLYLPVVGTHGVILLSWDVIVVKLSNPHLTDYMITTLGASESGL